jgi:hypothetical protein
MSKMNSTLYLCWWRATSALSRPIFKNVLCVGK